MIISKLLDIPYSFTAHAWDIFLNNPMLREKVKSAEFVITCTGYNKKYLDTMLGKEQESKVIKNYHGIDFNTLPEIDKNVQDNLIFSIGRLCEQKGFPYLIEACALLMEKGYLFHCIIVGEGPDRKILSKKIEQFGLQDQVMLVGAKPHNEIFELFNKARMFVLPCIISKNGDRDGIPNVMIEALAMRTPVISTNVSGVPEIIINGKTGLTVDPRNSSQLADAILKLHQDPQLSEIFADNGRRLVEQNFDIKKNVKELATIFLKQAKL